MKKIFLLNIIFLLLLPINIFADDIKLKVTTITLEDKSKTAEILNEPTYSNLDLNFEVKLQNIGDYIKYKVELENNTNISYLLNYNKENLNYINYQLDFIKEDKVINENGNTIFYLTIKKEKEIEEENDKDGINISTSELEFSLIPKNIMIKANPKTRNKMQIVLAFLLILFLILIIISFKKNTKKNLLLLFILLSLFIPIYSKALEENMLRIKILLVTEKEKNSN